jgi:hypothetical protein
VKQHSTTIVRPLRHAAALIPHEPRHALRQAVQRVDLVDQMRAEIVNRPIPRRFLDFPGVGGRVRAVAIEVRFEFRDVAQLTRRKNRLEGDEIRVPATVLVHGQFLARLRGEGAEFGGFRGGGDEGLLDDDVFAGLQGGLDHGVVRPGDAGDDDDVYAFVGEGLVDVAVGLCAGVVGFGVVVWFRGALDDGVEFVEGWEGEDEGDVEDFGAVGGYVSRCCCLI